MTSTATFRIISLRIKTFRTQKIHRIKTIRIIEIDWIANIINIINSRIRNSRIISTGKIVTSIFEILSIIWIFISIQQTFVQPIIIHFFIQKIITHIISFIFAKSTREQPDDQSDGQPGEQSDGQSGRQSDESSVEQSLRQSPSSSSSSENQSTGRQSPLTTENLKHSDEPSVESPDESLDEPSVRSSDGPLVEPSDGLSVESSVKSSVESSVKLLVEQPSFKSLSPKKSETTSWTIRWIIIFTTSSVRPAYLSQSVNKTINESTIETINQTCYHRIRPQISRLDQAVYEWDYPCAMRHRMNREYTTEWDRTMTIE